MKIIYSGLQESDTIALELWCFLQKSISVQADHYLGNNSVAYTNEICKYLYYTKNHMF